MALTQLQYTELIESVLDAFKTYVVTPVAGLSEIETRYITSVGENNEEWIQTLRKDDGTCDIWMISTTGFRGVRDEEQDSSTRIKKPMTVIIDYITDYLQGTDLDNTEKPFRAKCFGIDYYLEQKRRCLINNLEIAEWDARLGLRRFSTATTHIAKFDIQVYLTDVDI